MYSIERPTVEKMSHFDPSTDASVLRKAMKGMGTDEAAIISILGRRTCQERQEIIVKYQQVYGRDLVDDLKSELSGHFEEVIVSLMMPLSLFLATELHNAMSGPGTNERTLVEILCTRSNASIRSIKDAYYQHYSKKLEDDLKGDTSGDFRHLLLSMCACTREEDQYDPTLANGLAQALYNAGEGRLGTDEEEFNRILCSYSYPMLHCVFDEFKNIHGKSFEETLDEELSGSLKIGMKAIYNCIQNRPGYFAKELHDAMAGMGTNDHALIRLVVSRCEIDMGNIKEEYQALYDQTLEEVIENEASGDYKKVLLYLIEG